MHLAFLSGFSDHSPAIYESIKNVLKKLGGWQCVSDVHMYAQENSPTLNGIKRRRLKNRLDELNGKKEIEVKMISGVTFYRLPPGRFA